MVVLRGNDVTLHWTITKCLDGSEVPEDFSGSDLSVFVITLCKRVRVTALVVGNVITISLPGNTQSTGKIGVEAVWSKNNGKNWSRAKQVDVLDITDDPRKITTCSGATVDNHVVEINSKLVGSVGYDGLTPEIINGSWWIGSLDTGVPATGERGAPFTFDDFTPNQIDDLKRPAVEAAESVAKLEQSISVNELERAKTEQVRTQSEQERHVSEQHRVSSESTRVTAESGRTQSEAKRVSAEGERVSAEQLRVKAESNRLSEEAKRISSEQGREKAETKRVADSSEAIKQCDVATQGAKTQGDYAKEQGDAAKQAAIGAIDAKMALFIDMWNKEAGNTGKYNAVTGFFELNGLTDITYGQALDIFNTSIPARRSQNMIGYFKASTIRTNFVFLGQDGGGGSDNGKDFRDVFANCGSLEVLNVGLRFRSCAPSGAFQFSGKFRNCKKMKTIIGAISYMFDYPPSGEFSECILLESVAIVDLTKDITIKDSPNLNEASILTICTTRGGINPITITLHPTAYARAIANQEIVDKAVEKNITIASA